MNNNPGAPPMAIAAAAPAIRQTELFYRKALIEYPPQTETADSLGYVEADDYQRYYIKGDAHGRRVRASEWLCTHIAEEVRVSAPAATVIELMNGELVFGSRRIANVADMTVTTTFLTSPSASNVSPAATNLGSILSGVYALDLFLHNDDRHLGNYLSVEDGGIRRFYTFDFSRALFWSWPWNGFVPSGCNTRQWGSFLRFLHGFDTKEADTIIERLSSVPTATVEGFVNRMPADWLHNSERDGFLNWWAGDQRQRRLNALQTGMRDGTLL